MSSSFDTGDTAWMLTATALVLLMTMPGLAIYYSGMTREKNVLHCVMQIFTICSLITVLWLIFGYSLSFAPTNSTCSGMDNVNAVYGSGQRLWLLGMGLLSSHELAPTIPEALFCAYQLTFAIITAALICGSFAERMKFVPMILFIALWHLAVYCPIAHANWHPCGWLYQLGVLDYAGGNVVHITSGVSGLATVIIVGNRVGFGTSKFAEPHNILVTYMGMSMLWVGWFGFNAGSAYGANARAAFALLATQIATATSALMWMITEWAIRKKPSVLGMISGAVAGLVCITPAAGYVDMTGAFFIVFFGCPLCYAGAQLKHMMGYDDALDAFGVHAIGGIVGGIATGFFASPYIIANGGDINAVGARGVYYGSLDVGGLQLAHQLCGVLFAIVWAFIGTIVVLKLVEGLMGLHCWDACMGEHHGLRVSETDEVIGLDMSWHDEKAYKTADYMMNAAAATAAASSSIVMKDVKGEGPEASAAGSSGHDSGSIGGVVTSPTGSSSATTRGSVTVFDMTAWLKTGSSVGKTTGRDTGTRVETGTRAVTESSGLAPVLDPTGLAPALSATGLAPVLGATGLAPARVLEWKELDESKVTESNLV